MLSSSTASLQSALTHSTQTDKTAVWNELFTAIINNDFTKVVDLISNDEELLFDEDNDGNTVFHIALFSSHFEIVEYLLQQLQFQHPDDCQLVLSYTNHDGWTPLHIAAQFSDIKCFRSLVITLGELVSDQAKLVNQDGFLPLHLVDKNKQNTANKIRKHLEDFTIDFEAKQLHELVDKNASYQSLSDDEKHNPTLTSNLEYGIEAANYVRSLILVSSTSPACNTLDKKTFEEIRSKCRDVRIEYKTNNTKLNLSDTKDSDRFLILKNICAASMKHRAGRCYEYSNLVMQALYDVNFSELAEMYSISNGDHSFVVIGRDRNSNPSDYRTWGPNAVVVDAWAGQVYPAREIPKKLNDYFFYEPAHACITFPFHPEYHALIPTPNKFVLNKVPALVPVPIVPAPTVKKAKKIKLSLIGFFKSKKKDSVTKTSQTISVPRIK